MAIYLKYGDVKGDVTTTGFEDQVMVNSFQFGVGRGISSPTGSAGDRESSVASVSEVVVTKLFDVSSNPFFMEALMGVGVTAEISFTRTDQGKEAEYLKYKLENAMISGFSTSSGGDRPSESISINFAKITTTATLADKDNKDPKPNTVGWDLGKSAKV